jgi:hypothetical protein
VVSAAGGALLSAVSAHFQAAVGSREEADALLSQAEGSFLVRKSSWGDDCVALSVRSDDGQFQHFVLKYENGVWTDDGSGKKGASVDMLLGTIWPNMALTNKGAYSVRAQRQSQYGSLGTLGRK